MNFGYPFTPYGSNVNTEPNYMGNVSNFNMGTNMNMPDYTPNQGTCGMPNIGYGCNQVTQQTCAVDMPYYVNYHTHTVNNVIRRHIQIPVYSQSQEVVYFDEWQNSCGCNR